MFEGQGRNYSESVGVHPALSWAPTRSCPASSRAIHPCIHQSWSIFRNVLDNHEGTPISILRLKLLPGLTRESVCHVGREVCCNRVRSIRWCPINRLNWTQLCSRWKVAKKKIQRGRLLWSNRGSNPQERAELLVQDEEFYWMAASASGCSLCIVW